MKPGLFLLLLSVLSFSAQAQVMFLECPEGTKKNSVLEKNEIHEWCEDKDGVRQGGYSLKTSDGIPRVFVEYKDDKRDGQYVRYHENGKPAEQGILINDKPTGEWKRFHKNGSLSDRGFWKDGKPHGEWFFYHSNGKPEAQGMYASGKRVGAWKYYDEQGQLKSKPSSPDKALLLEAGYFGVYDGNGHSHAAVIGANWFPFQNAYLKGLAFSFRLGAVRGAGRGGEKEDQDVALFTLANYWEFGELMVGLQMGRVEVGGDRGNSFLGIDSYLKVNQKWVKRYGFNLAMLDNDVAAITAKAVLWEF